MSHASESSSLESTLDLLSRELARWEPEHASSLEESTTALRELMLHFDPRQERVAATLCAVGLTLLEAVDERGSVAPETAVGAVGELSRGLRDALAHRLSSAPARRGAHGNEVVLSLSSERSSGVSLSLGQVDQPIGQVLVKMGVMTQEQVDHVLETQAESDADPRPRFGEVAVELGYISESHVESALRLQTRARGDEPEPATPTDPWGHSPL